MSLCLLAKNRIDEVFAMNPDVVCHKWRVNKCFEDRGIDAKSGEHFCGSRGIIRLHPVFRYGWNFSNPPVFYFNLSASKRLNIEIQSYGRDSTPDPMPEWYIPCVADAHLTTLEQIFLFARSRLVLLLAYIPFRQRLIRFFPQANYNFKNKLKPVIEGFQLEENRDRNRPMGWFRRFLDKALPNHVDLKIDFAGERIEYMAAKSDSICVICRCEVCSAC